MLVLLFGGERGGGEAEDSVVISAGELAPDNIDLQLEATPPDDLREAEAELDLSNYWMCRSIPILTI